jgi:hypothetical protein
MDERGEAQKSNEGGVVRTTEQRSVSTSKNGGEFVSFDISSHLALCSIDSNN